MRNAVADTISAYGQTIRALSDQIVHAQKPIRILDALKWDTAIEQYFFKHKGKRLPPVTKEYYLQANPLSFDPQKKMQEFREIDLRIRRQLGQYSGIGGVMQRMCHEYCRVIELLLARGSHRFTEISQELYGSSEDAFHIGAPTLKGLAVLITDILANIQDQATTQADQVKYTSEEVVQILSQRLQQYFKAEQISVELSDGIIADAAAGADRIKIRKDALFSERDVRLFETHEGWVHLGTTLNGVAQPICTFLAKGTPSSTVTQEGLAIITEIFTFSSYPGRLRRLTNRILAINMAEEGANFLDVYQFYCAQGINERDSYQLAVRVFRGSTPEGGPFTKDLSYSKGFVLIYNYIRLAVQYGLVNRIPLLFLGKTTLDDLYIFADLMEEGIIVPPLYIPPQFADLAALSAWMAYSLFLNQLDLQILATDFKSILR